MRFENYLVLITCPVMPVLPKGRVEVRITFLHQKSPEKYSNFKKLF
jgi:hypothetical protein